MLNIAAAPRRQAMPPGSDPNGRERHPTLGDMLGQTGGQAGEPLRTDRFRARAEAQEAARLAGYKSPLRRLIERLLPRRQERGS
jgi:hypothetical protein